MHPLPVPSHSDANSLLSRRDVGETGCKNRSSPGLPQPGRRGPDRRTSDLMYSNPSIQDTDGGDGLDVKGRSPARTSDLKLLSRGDGIEAGARAGSGFGRGGGIERGGGGGGGVGGGGGGGRFVQEWPHPPPSRR